MKPLPDTSEHQISTSVKELFSQTEESPIFIQIDPTRYLYSQRHIAAKTEDAAVKSEDMQVKFSLEGLRIIFHS